MADIFNDKSSTLLTGTSGNDYIFNGGDYDKGEGFGAYKPYQWYAGGDNVTINGGGGDGFNPKRRKLGDNQRRRRQ